MKQSTFHVAPRLACVLVMGTLLWGGCWKRADDRRAPAIVEKQQPPQQRQKEPQPQPSPKPTPQPNGKRLSPSEIAQRALPAVVILKILRKGIQGSQGSGFFVRPRVVATNEHVIKGMQRGVAKLVDTHEAFAIERLLAVDRKRDLALLSVEETLPKSQVLPISRANEAAVGDRVYAAGNPRGLEGTFSQGIVSSLRTLNGQSFIQLTAPVSPGSSGGPVLNDRGVVIGVVKGNVPSGQNLNLAVPASDLRRLLDQTER